MRANSSAKTDQMAQFVRSSQRRASGGTATNRSISTSPNSTSDRSASGRSKSRFTRLTSAARSMQPLLACSLSCSRVR
ncbi:hypothetical protein D3C72_2331570 [compost metagenome]